MQNSVQSSVDSRLTRNAQIIAIVLLASAALTGALFLVLGIANRLTILFVPAGLLAASMVFDLLPLSLLRRGRRDLAMMLVLTVFLVNVVAVQFIVQGLGLIIVSAILLVVFSIVALGMSAKYTNAGAILAVVSAVAVSTLEFFLGADRLRVPELERYIPYIVAFMAAPLAVIFIREYRRFSLQAKITLGVLVTGGVAVAVIAFFALTVANRITSLLAARLESNVRRLAEAQLTNTVEREAKLTNDFFATFAHNATDLAEYRAKLHEQQGSLGQGNYWNASEKLIQLEGGHFGNPAGDVSSVFIPVGAPVDEAALLDLNASAYLDFIAPHNIEDNSSILAIYSINPNGIIRYYPNIQLASLLPPDFDATQRPYYKITSPLFNPDRLTRWTIPYVDAAGGGLVVTVASPIYYGDTFAGVVAADVQLSAITEQLANIKIGQSGFAFMVDDAGRLIHMPPAGYEMFGIDPSLIVADEFYKYTILGQGSRDLINFTNRMVAGGSGLGIVKVNGVDTYIAFSPIPANGYSLGLVVPTAEMQTAIPATQQETRNQFRAATQTALLIMVSTFLGALVVSIALGRLISAPVRGLIQAANRIAGGDLSARAQVISGDETGALADSFNLMADRLSDTLQGLEDRIAERTHELSEANQSNAHRASLFEAIARISRVISASQNVEQLLPQITETISSQLGYYHVGIFLVDVHREFAVLVAANSEGGKTMLARGHRLRIGETGIVGFVTETGNPRVALDVGKDAVYFDNPDLPETHSEIALPLRGGPAIIGALDVQSKVANAFSEEDVNILSVLADQVSVAIQNARSFQESQQAREQAERAAAQLSEQQWHRFVKRQTTPGYHFDGVNSHQVGPGIPIHKNQLSIPILLRGNQIGALKLSAADPERQWDDNEIAMAQATAERAALAIETARLLEDAQKRAAKERAIGQISSKIGGLVNIENIIRTTVEELGGALPDTDVAIQFNTGHSTRSDGSSHVR